MVNADNGLKDLASRVKKQQDQRHADHLLRTIQLVHQTGGAVEIYGVRIEKCDAYGRTQGMRDDEKIERVESLLRATDSARERALGRARDAESKESILLRERDRDREHIRRLQETNDELRANLGRERAGLAVQHRRAKEAEAEVNRLRAELAEARSTKRELPTDDELAEAIDSHVPDSSLWGTKSVHPHSAARRVRRLLEERGF